MELIRKSVASIYEHMITSETLVPFEMVIVANGTPKEAFDALLADYPAIVRWTYVGGNLGPAMAHNIFFFNLCHAPYALSSKLFFVFFSHITL